MLTNSVRHTSRDFRRWRPHMHVHVTATLAMIAGAQPQLSLGCHYHFGLLWLPSQTFSSHRHLNETAPSSCSGAQHPDSQRALPKHSWSCQQLVQSCPTCRKEPLDASVGAAFMAIVHQHHHQLHSVAAACTGDIAAWQSCGASSAVRI